jgi:Flp pilus assembly protein TadG
MVEYALVMLFLFVLFVSILQVILLMYAYSTLANAAKEGIRYAIVHGTGFGSTGCSGPGNPSVTPTVSCTSDSTGAQVQTAVTKFAGLSFQNVTSSDVTVCYDPKNDGTCATDKSGANGTSSFGAACSAPGCLVRVTVSHTYSPLFGLNWASFKMNAAAEGRIAD